MQNKVRFPVLALAGYFKAERLVGEACENLSRREGANELFFTHSDHLGSSSWTTDADGRAVQHIEYLPFGEELLNQRATSYSERYTFTGKELDEESNLYYYDARYNSSTYSQFTAVDPMSDKYPSVNPYLYCAGNPVIYVDPDGREWDNHEEMERYKKIINNYQNNNNKEIERLKNRIGKLDSEKTTYQKERTRLEQKINNLRIENDMMDQAISDIDYLAGREEHFNTDSHLSDFNYVKKDENGVITAYANNLACLCHEIAHIRQYFTMRDNINTLFDFADMNGEMILNYSTKLAVNGKTSMDCEVEAYKIQYSLSHSFPGEGVYKVSDITADKVRTIKKANGSSLYK